MHFSSAPSARLTRERVTHETSGDINPDESRLLLWAEAVAQTGP
jgi:hypothetical protein